MTTEMIMPEMGEGVIEGTVYRWLKQIGDAVEQYEPIVEIETDKVTTEGLAETAGTLLAIHIKEGTTVDVGTSEQQRRPFCPLRQLARFLSDLAAMASFRRATDP